MATARPSTAALVPLLTWVAEFMFGGGGSPNQVCRKNVPRGPHHKNLRSPEIKEPLEFFVFLALRVL